MRRFATLTPESGSAPLDPRHGGRPPRRTSFLAVLTLGVMAAAIASPSVARGDGAVIQVPSGDVGALYRAVYGPGNAGATILLEAGTYLLDRKNRDAPDDVARGRLVLQAGQVLRGPMDGEAVIDGQDVEGPENENFQRLNLIVVADNTVERITIRNSHLWAMLGTEPDAGEDRPLDATVAHCRLEGLGFNSKDSPEGPNPHFEPGGVLKGHVRPFGLSFNGGHHDGEHHKGSGRIHVIDNVVVNVDFPLVLMGGGRTAGGSLHATIEDNDLGQGCRNGMMLGNFETLDATLDIESRGNSFHGGFLLIGGGDFGTDLGDAIAHTLGGSVRWRSFQDTFSYASLASATIAAAHDHRPDDGFFPIGNQAYVLLNSPIFVHPAPADLTVTTTLSPYGGYYNSTIVQVCIPQTAELHCTAWRTAGCNGQDTSTKNSVSTTISKEGDPGCPSDGN